MRGMKPRKLPEVGAAPLVGQGVELLQECGVFFRTVRQHPRDAIHNRVRGLASLAAQDTTFDFIGPRRMHRHCPNIAALDAAGWQPLPRCAVVFADVNLSQRRGVDSFRLERIAGDWMRFPIRDTDRLKSTAGRKPS